MTLILRKEFAFLSLVAQYLDYTDAEIKAYEKLITHGAEIAPQFWQMIIEKLSGSKFVDANGYDFADFSEAKTGSVTMGFNHNKGYATRNGRITNAKKKIGYMRVAVWNECVHRLDYFLLPPDHDCKSYSCTANPVGAIHFGYAETKDTYSNGLEKYRSNIENVCRPLTELGYSAA
jgi:hypothetical protein